MSRRVVVVDTETTGLDAAVAVPVEVAWCDLSTGENGLFIPRHDVDDPDVDPEALRINGYWDRIAGRAQSGYVEAEYLHRVLDGAALAGSNPRFDAAMLGKLFADYELSPGPWHHRLPDLASYAAGALGLWLDELPGLAKVCELLEVAAPDHSAAGDVRATVECFRKLRTRATATEAQQELTEALQIVKEAATELRLISPNDVGADDLDRAARLITKWRPAAVRARATSSGTTRGTERAS